MSSDFPASRLYLERACDYLRGDDDTSCKAREALDLLIEAVATAEFIKPRGKVVPLATERTRKQARRR